MAGEDIVRTAAVTEHSDRKFAWVAARSRALEFTA